MQDEGMAAFVVAYFHIRVSVTDANCAVTVTVNYRHKQHPWTRRPSHACARHCRNDLPNDNIACKERYHCIRNVDCVLSIGESESFQRPRRQGWSENYGAFDCHSTRALQV